MTVRRKGPLAGVRVLEIGNFVAAPFCTRLLADLGADVIKIEPTDGDPVRQWGKQLKGRSVWWSLHGRNKRSVALDLKHRRALDVVLRIVRECDALIENFRPGHLEALGLSEKTLRNARADLVIARISTAAPSNAYASADSKWVLIAANSDPLFARLAQLMSQPELASDRRFNNNKVRVENVEALDSIISAWTTTLTAAQLVEVLTENDIPCCQAYPAAEIAADPHFRSRGMVIEVDDPLFGRILHPGIVPQFSDDAGDIRWCGPDVGAHTGEVLAQVARLSKAEIDDLRNEGVIAS